MKIIIELHQKPGTEISEKEIYNSIFENEDWFRIGIASIIKSKKPVFCVENQFFVIKIFKDEK